MARPSQPGPAPRWSHQALEGVWRESEARGKGLGRGAVRRSRPAFQDSSPATQPPAECAGSRSTPDPSGDGQARGGRSRATSHAWPGSIRPLLCPQWPALLHSPHCPWAQPFIWLGVHMGGCGNLPKVGGEGFGRRGIQPGGRGAGLHPRRISVIIPHLGPNAGLVEGGLEVGKGREEPTPTAPLSGPAHKMPPPWQPT